jgi:hypothetical protein
MVSSYFGLILLINKYDSREVVDKKKIYEHLHRISEIQSNRKKDFIYREIFSATYSSNHLFFSVAPRGCVYTFRNKTHFVYISLFDGREAVFDIGADVSLIHEVDWSTDGVYVRLRTHEELCFVFDMEQLTLPIIEHGFTDKTRTFSKNVPKYYDFREFKTVSEFDGHKVITIFITVYIISNTTNYPEEFINFLNLK